MLFAQGSEGCRAMGVMRVLGVKGLGAVTGFCDLSTSLTKATLASTSTDCSGQVGGRDRK